MTSLLKMMPNNSVATKRGWVDKTTGELLVAMNDLPNKLKEERDRVDQLIKNYPKDERED